jgi:hypothetical protein
MGSAPDEFQELKEHAEHAIDQPEMAPVSFTMAVLAVLLAIVSLLGHRAHTEEVLLQNQATDQWNFYQAKNIRRSSYETLLDQLSISDLKDKEAAAKIREKYEKNVERLRDEQSEIQKEAQTLQAEVGIERRRANRFDLGEAFLEVALVVTSITLLTRRRFFWGFGLGLGTLGILVALTAGLVH